MTAVAAGRIVTVAAKADALVTVTSAEMAVSKPVIGSMRVTRTRTDEPPRKPLPPVKPVVAPPTGMLYQVGDMRERIGMPLERDHSTPIQRPATKSFKVPMFE